jgi:hypothetical protein
VSLRDRTHRDQHRSAAERFDQSRVRRIERTHPVDDAGVVLFRVLGELLHGVRSNCPSKTIRPRSFEIINARSVLSEALSSAVAIPLRHPYSDLWRGAAVLSFIDALP